MPISLRLDISLAVVAPALLFSACSSRPAAQWRDAQSRWEHGADSATSYRQWLAIDPASPEGHEAQRRLALADAHYRRVTELLERREPGVREEVALANAAGPMNPELLLPLARVCRDRGLLARAVEFYDKYLASLPDPANATVARAERRALVPEADPFAAETPPSTEMPSTPASAIVIGSLLLATILALATSFFLLFLGRRRRAPRRSLAAVALGNPELHPTLAYLVRSLRHELLKHRVGAVEGAIRALSRGDASAEMREFVVRRLYGGEPLEAAWAAYVGAFERTLGPSSLRRADPAIRRASTAIRRIAGLRKACLAGDSRVPARLARAHAELQRCDREMAALAASLSRCTVDEALLREAVDAVRGEFEAGAVHLDELAIAPVPEGVVVEVYRIDLRIILKNVVRNAILAVARAGEAGARRVRLDVLVALDVTGEEVVRIRVHHTSAEPLTVEEIRARPVDRPPPARPSPRR